MLILHYIFKHGFSLEKLDLMTKTFQHKTGFRKKEYVEDTALMREKSEATFTNPPERSNFN